MVERLKKRIFEHQIRETNPYICASCFARSSIILHCAHFLCNMTENKYNLCVDKKNTIKYVTGYLRKTKLLRFRLTFIEQQIHSLVLMEWPRHLKMINEFNIQVLPTQYEIFTLTIVRILRIFL